MREFIKKIVYALGLKKKSQPKTKNRHHLVGNVKNWKMKRDFQIKFLKDRNLLPKNTLLDIGCGTLRGGIPIIRYLEEGNYTGIEIRQAVLDEGIVELKQENLENKKPRLVHFEDFSSLHLDTKYDYIFAFSVMIHLEDAIAEKCFDFVSRHLASKGTFYVNVNLENHDDISWQGFPVKFKEIDFYTNLASKVGLEITQIGKLKEFGHISNDTLSDNQMMLAVTKV